MEAKGHTNLPETVAEREKMRMHFLTLSFGGELEKLYNRSILRNTKYLFQIRVVLLLTIFFYFAFGFLDLLLFPKSFWILFKIRFCIVGPYIFLTFLFSYTRYFEKYSQHSFFLVSIVAGTGIVMMIVLVPPPLAYAYYAGMILVFMFTYSFARVRFIWATSACWILILFYEVLAVKIAGTPIPILINNNFFFISANIIGMAACYLLEYFERRNFYITMQLEHEKQKTRRINQELEQRVLERTALLNSSNEELILEVEERKRIEEALRKISNELEIRVENRTFELVNANRELEQAKKKADASALAKSEFLANMSHEIRNPMNAIIGMVDLAMNDRIHAPQRKKYLEIIKKSSKSLLVIINDILDLSKIEAGKLELDNISFNIREYVESIGDIFINEFQSKGLEFIIDIADDVPVAAKGDPVRLQQVLLNLIGNALKFTEKGEICVKLTRGNISFKNIELLFEVIDSGIGIDLNEKQDLFEAFSQGDGSITRRYGGTGLGLTICKRIVNMMNGIIYVDSSPGSGSSFKFSVVLERDKDFLSESSEDFSKVDPLDVLVIVNNAKLQEVCIRILKSYGFYVTSVNDGLEAIEAFKQFQKQKKIDLIVMDEDVSGKSSLEVLDAVKSVASGSVPPFIMLGNIKTREEISALKSRGMTAYISKPLKSSELFEAVLKIFHKKKENISLSRKAEANIRREFRGMEVLLVEDNPINQIVASEILALGGVVVTIAGNGHEAVEYLEKGKYDIVLMDIQMPKMDGIQATKLIRKQVDTSTPIVAMTAHVMQGDRENCIEAGMNDFISKPIDREELFRVLSKFYVPESDPVPEKIHQVVPSDAGLELAGVDVEDALSRLSCSYKVFSEILSNFCSFYNNIDQRIEKFIEKNDMERAAKEIHSLKGAAINVSAVNLYLVAQEFEIVVATGGDGTGLSEYLEELKLKMIEVEDANHDLKRYVENEIRL